MDGYKLGPAPRSTAPPARLVGEIPTPEPMAGGAPGPIRMKSGPAPRSSPPTEMPGATQAAADARLGAMPPLEPRGPISPAGRAAFQSRGPGLPQKPPPEMTGDEFVAAYDNMMGPIRPPNHEMPMETYVPPTPGPLAEGEGPPVIAPRSLDADVNAMVAGLPKPAATNPVMRRATNFAASVGNRVAPAVMNANTRFKAWATTPKPMGWKGNVGTVAAGALADAVNNPEVVLHPGQSYGQAFRDMPHNALVGTGRLLNGWVSPGELGRAAWDSTGGAFANAGYKGGQTLRRFATDPQGAGTDFINGLNLINQTWGGTNPVLGGYIDPRMQGARQVNRNGGVEMYDGDVSGIAAPPPPPKFSLFGIQ